MLSAPQSLTLPYEFLLQVSIFYCTTGARFIQSENNVFPWFSMFPMNFLRMTKIECALAHSPRASGLRSSSFLAASCAFWSNLGLFDFKERHFHTLSRQGLSLKSKNPATSVAGFSGWLQGFEPWASRATIWRANQLRHTHHKRTHSEC